MTSILPDDAGLPDRPPSRTSEREDVSNERKYVSRCLKTMMDYTVSGFLCVLLLPVVSIIAILVRLDGGPAIFRHRRLGIGGRPFDCLKFRSMHMNAADMLAERLRTDPAARHEWDVVRKLAVDPRITPIGAFLRRTSLDELPQLWNVLRGEMSLVGPRPIVISETALYGEWFRIYVQVKPGVTGLWQTSGRSGTSYAQRVALDIWYVRHWSLWQDLVILAQTIPAVLLRRGAV